MRKGTRKHALDKFLERSEVYRILKAAQGNARDYYLLSATFYLGLRAKEVVSLRVPHFDWRDEDELDLVDVPTAKRRVRPGDPVDEHTGMLSVTVPIIMGQSVLRRMCEWAGDRTWIFTGRSMGPMSPKSAAKRFKVHARAAGISPRVSMHALRHSCGTMVREMTGNNVITREYLRHTDEASTQIYTHGTRPAWERAREALLGGGA